MEENKLSEFLKLAQKKGKVRNIEDAFEDYPVENEWHQGKIENVIREISHKHRNSKKLVRK